MSARTDTPDPGVEGTDVRVVEYTPTGDELGHTFGGRPPVMYVDPGTVLRVYTEDCFGGRVTTVSDLPSRVCDPTRLNPVTGPFHVNGARPGDTLAVHIVSITPARDWGVSATFPHFGALTSTHTTATLQPPLEERVWIYRIDPDTGTLRYTATGSDHVIDLPSAPMIGTIGVAPAGGEVHSTIVPDTHGGNMDLPLLGAGTTVYLPVGVDGAQLALGDGHARQGDGEVCGVAVEIATHVVFTVDVLPGVSIPGPRLESDTHLWTVGSARPLEDAYRISQHDLVTWVGGLTGLDTLDAYQLVSQAGTAYVGNVCDPNYTMAAGIPKALLPGAVAHGGVHRRLRSATRALPGTRT